MKELNNQTYDYVLVGGGMGAGFATLGIREQDQEGSILIISNETHVPYERPALTKKLWIDDEFQEEDTKIGAEDEENVEIVFEREVVKVSPEDQTVTLENGDVVHYGNLLLSTGGEPNTIEGPEDEDVFTFRELDDYRKLRARSGDNQEVLIVGGGYIGSELAASLSQNNTNVTMVFPQEQLGADMFPEALLEEYNQLFTDHGVKLISEVEAESYSREGDQLVLKLSDGSEIKGETIVIGLGVSPRIKLAEESGLEMSDQGVVVNEKLQTSDENIWAAADIATYPDVILGRQRLEHVDHARNSGQQVGANIAGADEAYTHTPYLYSMLYSLNWEAVGTLDPTLDIMIDERDEGKIVFYLDGDQLQGVLVWNVEVDLDDVRNLLDNPPADKEDLIGAIPEKEAE